MLPSSSRLCVAFVINSAENVWNWSDHTSKHFSNEKKKTKDGEEIADNGFMEHNISGLKI